MLAWPRGGRVAFMQGERHWEVPLEEPARWPEVLEREAGGRAPLVELMPPGECLLVFLDYPQRLAGDLERLVRLDLEVRSPWEGAAWLMAPPLEAGERLRVPVFLARPEAIRARALHSIHSVPVAMLLVELLDPEPCLLLLGDQALLCRNRRLVGCAEGRGAVRELLGLAEQLLLEPRHAWVVDEGLQEEARAQGLELRPLTDPYPRLASAVRARRSLSTFQGEVSLGWPRPARWWGLALLPLLCMGWWSWALEGEARRLRQEVQAAESQLSRCKAEMARLEGRLKRLQEQAAAREVLEGFRGEFPAVLRLLAGITRAADRNTWVRSLRMRPGEVVLRGQSPSALEFLKRLSRLPAVSEARFGSTVRRTGDGMERFDIVLRLQGS